MLSHRGSVLNIAIRASFSSYALRRWGGSPSPSSPVGCPENLTLSPTQTQTLPVSPASQSDSDSDPTHAREQSVRLSDPV